VKGITTRSAASSSPQEEAPTQAAELKISLVPRKRRSLLSWLASVLHRKPPL
jgi:hypothetical protein